MDPKSKEEAIGLGTKIFGFLGAILPPVIIGNVTHWAAAYMSRKKLTKVEIVVLFSGSFGIASFVHWLVSVLGWEKYEWAIIWSSSVTAHQILRFVYMEFGGIVKNWLRSQVAQALNGLSKKKA